MVRLIQKSGFIKPGKAAGYLNYIATRDGVEIVGPDGYLEYMATRPGSHGLFGSEPVVDLNAVMKGAEQHTGHVWTLIYSLHREDAARLGYDNAESWRKLIKAHQVELATAMKIPPEQFRWYAAYHDADTHPHIHMTVWSDDPKLGFLTPDGIKSMRSVMTNSIFQDDLYSLYQQKDISYKELTAQARASMRELVVQMESSLCDSPSIEMQMVQLAHDLKNVSGKKVYGYLKKPLKEQVDTIVDELAKLPVVAEYYEVWNQLRDELESYYKDKPRQRLPLSQQKEFKAIKNMVIREAENLRLGVLTFEDERLLDEPLDSTRFSDPEISNEEKRSAVAVLERNWRDNGSPSTAYQLGRVWRDGLGVLPDDEKAELWLQRAAEAGHGGAQYALAKLLYERGRVDEALPWYEQAAANGNQFANYQLGKLYLSGERVPKDMNKALEHFTNAAEQEPPLKKYMSVLITLAVFAGYSFRAVVWFVAAKEGRTMYDYMKALVDRFAPPPMNGEQRQELEAKRQAVSALLDKQGRKKLLRLVDAHTVTQEEMALSSFIAGFRLAWGIAMELGADGSYSYEQEQEQINRKNWGAVNKERS